MDFRKLKEALPQELAGFEKGESSGEKNNAFGISVSEAKQSFRTADGNKRVRFEITDPGSLAGPFALANVWLNVEVDKESGDGYEKEHPRSVAARSTKSGARAASTAKCRWWSATASWLR